MRRMLKVAVVAGAAGAAYYYEPIESRMTSHVIPQPVSHIPTSPITHGEYDLAVVGGGIIGLATAREFQKRHPSLKVAVLEKEGEVAPHQSGHNSGVIHAGMYYLPGTKIAKCCVEGVDLMYAYAKEKGIPHRRCGKFIVATNEEEHKQVELLYTRGVKNGVKGLRIIDGEEVKRLEPNVTGAYSALDSPNTGIIDYAEVTRSLAKDLEKGKGDIHLHFEAQRFVPVDEGLEIVGREVGQQGPWKTLKAKKVITCAGLWMDKVGKQAGGSSDPKVMTFRGRYYQMKPGLQNLVERNIYPVPQPTGIPTGIHFTPTVNRDRKEQMIVGPGACMCFSKEAYNFTSISPAYLYDVITNVGFWKFACNFFSSNLAEVHRDLSKAEFLDQARKLVPGLTDDMVESSFAGVMAQVFTHDGQPATDFIVERNCNGGKVLNLRNAPSPAATSSLAIAKMLLDMAEEDGWWKK